MADNTTFTPGTGGSMATDDIGGVHYQRNKIALGLDGAHDADLAGTAARGAYVDPRLLQARLVITPTISTSAYASGDQLGGLMEITNAARTAGGSGVVTSVVMVDKTQAQRAPIDLLFFDRSVTVAADNAVATFSDSDLEYCLGLVPIGAYNTAWAGTPANSLSTFVGVGLPYVLSGTSLFVAAVVRSAPTYTSTSDLVFAFTVLKD